MFFDLFFLRKNFKSFTNHVAMAGAPSEFASTDL